MAEFLSRGRIAAPAELVEGWLARRDANLRLHPVWEPGPVFELRWRHKTMVKPDGEGCEVEDRVEYSHPVTAKDPFIEARLRRVFDYRCAVMRHDLERRARHPERKLRVLVAGSSGMIGQALIPMLRAGGHEVMRLVRSDPSQGELRWAPMKGKLEAKALEGFDAVVNLAGASIAAKRWTRRRKYEIFDSRVKGTGLLASKLAGLDKKPKVLVNASAMGYYGGSAEPVTEESPPGKGFLAETCKRWEAAAEPAEKAGIRTVKLRIGMVLSPRGGALMKMLPPFRMFMGGPIGEGSQPVSWISIEDMLGVIHRCLTDGGFRGAYNCTAPGNLPNREFMTTLGEVLSRPSSLPLPAFMVRLLFGEMGKALLLGGAPVKPERLEKQGYDFLYPELEPALRFLLGT